MPRLVRVLLFALALALVVHTTVRAQEVQIPMDESGQLTVLDEGLEARLDLFPATQNFREARLFRQPEGTYVLVIQSMRDGTIVQERRALTESEVAALRQRITAAISAVNLRPAIDQSGRVSLLWTAAGLSLLAYGPSLVAALDIQEDTPAGTIVLLSGAAGFFVPYFATRSNPVSASSAALSRSGALIGYAQGAALASVIGGEHTSRRALASAGLALSIGEALAAYRFATSTGLARGAGETMTFGSLYGAGFGLGTSVLLVGDDFDEPAVRLVSALGLAGSVLGTFAGYRLTRIENQTRGDARILSTAGTLGLLVGGTFLTITDAEEGTVTASALMAGAAAGLANGYLLTRGRDFSKSQGNFVALGSLAGGLVGAAASNVVGAGTEADAVLTTLGSVVGFGAMYVGYRTDAMERAGRSVELSAAPFLEPIHRRIRPAFRLRARF